MNEDDEVSKPGDEEREARDAILARRARFVAAALASVGLSGAACSGETGAGAAVCLSLAAGGSGGTAVEIPDAAPVDAGSPEGGDAADGAEGGPQVCLTVY